MKRKHLGQFLGFLAALALVLPINAADFTWDGDTDTSANTATNWVGDTAPNGSDIGLIFGTTGAGTVVIDAPIADVNQIDFTDDPYTLDPAATETIALSADSAVNVSTTGTITINTGLVLANATSDTGTTINIAASGYLILSGDITEAVAGTSKLVIDGTDGTGSVDITGTTDIANLTVTNAYVYLADDVTLSGTSQYITSGTGYLDILGDVELSGTANFTITDGYLDGDLTLDDDATATITGDINDDVTLNDNAVATITGNITNDVILNDASKLFVDGNINGAVGLTLAGTSTFEGNTTITNDLTAGSTSTLQVDLGIDDDPANQNKITIQGNMNLATGVIVEATIDLNKVEGLDTEAAAGTTTRTGIIVEGNVTVDTTAVTGLTATINTTGGINADFDLSEIAELITVARIDASLELAEATGSDNFEVIITINGVKTFTELADEAGNESLGALLDVIDDQSIANVTALTTDQAAMYALVTPMNLETYNTLIQDIDKAVNSSAITGMAAAHNVSSSNRVLANHMAARRSNMPILAQQNASSQMSMLAGLTNDPKTLAQATDEQKAQPLPVITNDWAAFVKIYGVFSDQDTIKNSIGYSADTVGVQFGMDYKVNDNWLVGLALDYASTDISIEAGTGDIDVDTFRVGPFVSYTQDQWYIDGSLSYGVHSNDATINYGVLGTDEAEYDAYDISFYIGGGYDFTVAKNWTLTPTVSLQYTHYDRDEYTTDTLTINTDIDSFTYDALYSRLGVKLATQIEAIDMLLIPELALGWEHEFLDDTNDVDATLAGGSFAVQTQNPDQNSIFVGLGLTAVIQERVSTYIRYEGNFNGDGETHGITGGLRVDF